MENPVRSLLKLVVLSAGWTVLFAQVSAAQFGALGEPRPVELHVTEGIAYGYDNFQAEEYYFLKYGASHAVSIVQLIFDSDLRFHPDIAPRLDELCVLQANLVHDWRSFRGQREQFEQRYNQRVGAYRGEAPPYTDDEIKESDRLGELYRECLARFDERFRKVFPEDELRIRLLQRYSQQHLWKHGLSLVWTLALQCEGVWGREFKDRDGNKLAAPFHERCGQFEEVCLARFNSDFREALKSSINPLTPIQKERLLKILPVDASDIAFSRNGRTKGGFYRRFLQQFASSQPRERLHAITDSLMEVCRTTPRISDLQSTYGRKFRLRESAEALKVIEDKMIDVQVAAALDHQQSLGELKASLARLIQQEDVESALRHPVFMRFCKLEQADIERLHLELHEHHSALQEQWAMSLTTGSLEAIKDLLAEKDFEDLEKVVSAIDVRSLDIITNLVAHKSASKDQ